MRTADPALNPSSAAALQMASPPPSPPRPHAGEASGQDGAGRAEPSAFPALAPRGGRLLPGVPVLQRAAAGSRAGSGGGRAAGDSPVHTPPHTCTPPRSRCETPALPGPGAVQRPRLRLPEPPARGSARPRSRGQPAAFPAGPATPHCCQHAPGTAAQPCQGVGAPGRAL